MKEAERELGQAELLLSELRQLQGRLLQERGRSGAVMRPGYGSAAA
ncbi:hypothetical protein VQ056_04340 [Paenibacillus sp. JTLBN-2024]